VDVTLGVRRLMVRVWVTTVRVVRINPAICAQPADREVLHVGLESRVVFQLRSKPVQVAGWEVNGLGAVLAYHVVVARGWVCVLVVCDAFEHDLVQQVQRAEQANRPIDRGLVDSWVSFHHALVDVFDGDVPTQILDRVEDQYALGRQPVAGSFQEVDGCLMMGHAYCNYLQQAGSISAENRSQQES
jgi:hypothetical protein